MTAHHDGADGKRKGRRRAGPGRGRPGAAGWKGDAAGWKDAAAGRKGGAGGRNEGAEAKAAPRPPRAPAPRPSDPSRPKGFRHAAALVDAPIRGALHKRGFAELRVLTDWAEIAGPALAEVCKPLRVSYSNGFGATLHLWVAPGRGPELQMQSPRIVERVNAFYGYRAVSRIRVSQTAPGRGGFSAPSQGFDRSAAPGRPNSVQDIPPDIAARADDLARGVAEEELRDALARLGRNVIGRARAAAKKDDV